MKIAATALACALAASAGAQEPSKSEAQKPRPALNLRLDDATSAAPRVTFGPTPSAQTKEEREKGLPELGGKPSDSYNRPISGGSTSSSSGAVIPTPMDPSVNAR